MILSRDNASSDASFSVLNGRKNTNVQIYLRKITLQVCQSLLPKHCMVLMISDNLFQTTFNINSYSP